MKDFTKCGLSCPQELTRIVIKVINECYNLHLPENFYRVLLLDENDNTLECKRGYVLGMFNYGFTLI